ncbi:MAG TPA: calcium-binding protein [Candidatus Polarisedimenticolia bacterium]|nr:calcium-binding protein [Candidatus Polarisedimenticolia bacterium]
MVEEAIVDAYGESEQAVGLFTIIEDKLALPFETKLLGVDVKVERIDMNEADEIVAICRRGRHRQPVPILDLLLPWPKPAGWEWIEAYRWWATGGR